MRKLVRIASTATLAIGLMTGVAAADTTVSCNISNTGQGSVNTCVDKTDTSKTVFCDNTGHVADVNVQGAGSGNANSNGNTTGGFTTSGNASNNNTATVTVGASCAPVETASTSTPPSTAPAAGGKGGAATTPAASSSTPTAAAAPASLPETGSDSAQRFGIYSVVVLAGTLGLAQVARFAYRRLALR